MDTLRLFVAIPLSAAIRQELSNLKFPIDHVRWVPDEQLHLTLKFAGNLKRDNATRLAEELESVRYATFDYSVKGVGTFPKSGPPKVVWAGIQAPEDLMNLQKNVARVAEKCGAKVEKRPYKPHITLARVKKDGIQRSRIKSLLDSGYQQEFGTMAVHQFILYRSLLNSRGAKHVAIKKYHANIEP